MEEMKQVSQELTKMGHFIMEKHREAIRPDALLAEAMRMDQSRGRNLRGGPRGGQQRRKTEGFETLASLNSAIGEFLYQSDILLDMRQTEEMWKELKAEDQNQTLLSSPLLPEEFVENSTTTTTTTPTPNNNNQSSSFSSVPDIPGLPVLPGLSDPPVIPVLPDLPVIPVVPDTPVLPSLPDLPVILGLPDTPVHPASPVDQQQQGFSNSLILEYKLSAVGDNNNNGEGGSEAEGRKVKKRQAQTGQNFPRNQWNPADPISYTFDPRLSNDARKVVRAAVKFWTENTCLSFTENGPGTPRVRFFPGGGCYSNVGRAFQQREQLVSLGGYH
jgi:hypothetical protein